MTTHDDKLILRSPASPSDWDIYFDLRWRILRAPWASFTGASAMRPKNLLFTSCFSILSARQSPVADCILTILTKPRSDIWPLMRMPAVAAAAAGFLRPWKPRRVDERPRKIVLNARGNVVQFYARHGYAMTGQAETLFGVIRHWRMEKVL
jgi:hypothetical protein